MAGFHRRADATVDTVPTLRRELRGYLEAAGVRDEDTLYAVELAVTEAVGNVVRHAYPDRAGEVEVSALRRDAHLEVVVRDDGVGAGQASEQPGAGFGTQIIRREASACSIETGEGGTTVVMRFDLDPGAGAG
jgi:anti-sigma regulatory factor (Ser/Thr protein kinase)